MGRKKIERRTFRVLIPVSSASARQLDLNPTSDEDAAFAEADVSKAIERGEGEATPLGFQQGWGPCS